MYIIGYFSSQLLPFRKIPIDSHFLTLDRDMFSYELTFISTYVFQRKTLIFQEMSFLQRYFSKQRKPKESVIFAHFLGLTYLFKNVTIFCRFF